MRLLLSAILSLALCTQAGAAYLYSNDFSGMTEPPANWTEQVASGTTAFLCDDVDLAPEIVGLMQCYSAEHPQTRWTYDNGGSWQSYHLVFEKPAGDFWTILEVLVRYDLASNTFYRFEYDRPNSTFKLFKDSSELQSVFEDFNDTDELRFTVEGTTSVTMTVYINDVQKIQAVDAAAPHTSGTIGLGLRSVNDYGSVSMFFDNLYVDEIVPPTPTPAPTAAPSAGAGSRPAVRSFKGFKDFKEGY